MECSVATLITCLRFCFRFFFSVLDFGIVEKKKRHRSSTAQLDSVLSSQHIDTGWRWKPLVCFPALLCRHECSFPSWTFQASTQMLLRIALNQKKDRALYECRIFFSLLLHIPHGAQYCLPQMSLHSASRALQSSVSASTPCIHLAATCWKAGAHPQPASDNDSVGIITTNHQSAYIHMNIEHTFSFCCRDAGRQQLIHNLLWYSQPSECTHSHENWAHILVSLSGYSLFVASDSSSQIRVHKKAPKMRAIPIKQYHRWRDIWSMLWHEFCVWVCVCACVCLHVGMCLYSYVVWTLRSSRKTSHKQLIDINIVYFIGIVVILYMYLLTLKELRSGRKTAHKQLVRSIIVTDLLYRASAYAHTYSCKAQKMKEQDQAKIEELSQLNAHLLHAFGGIRQAVVACHVVHGCPTIRVRCSKGKHYVQVLRESDSLSSDLSLDFITSKSKCKYSSKFLNRHAAAEQSILQKNYIANLI